MKTKLLFLFAILILLAIVLVSSGDQFSAHSIQSGLIQETTTPGRNNSLSRPLVEPSFGDFSDDGQGEDFILSDGNWR